MARIARWTQKIFASSATNTGVFGSGQLGTKVLTTSLADIQSLSAWSSGWLSAVLDSKKFPPLEEVQAIDYLVTTQLAYIFQEGVPEYDAGTTYYHYSIVKKVGTFQLYGSKTDSNVGNALTDTVNWLYLCDLSNINVGLLPANNLSDVSNAATSLSNIGGLAKASNLSDLANIATALTNLGFTSGTNWVKLPASLGCYLFQWGTWSGTTSGSSPVYEGGVTVSFPKSFASNLGFFPSVQDVSGGGLQETVWYNGLNLNNCGVQFSCKSSGVTMSGYWFAIGT